MKIRRYVLNRIHRANGTSTMLPTAQELAKQFGCSRPTVCKAMKTLTEDGFVIGKPGIGSFINPALESCHGGGSMSGLPIIGIIFGDGMVVHYEIFFGKVLARILERNGPSSRSAYHQSNVDESGQDHSRDPERGFGWSSLGSPVCHAGNALCAPEKRLAGCRPARRADRRNGLCLF